MSLQVRTCQTGEKYSGVLEKKIWRAPLALKMYLPVLLQLIIVRSTYFKYLIESYSCELYIQVQRGSGWGLVVLVPVLIQYKGSNLQAQIALEVFE